MYNTAQQTLQVPHLLYINHHPQHGTSGENFGLQLFALCPDPPKHIYFNYPRAVFNIRLHTTCTIRIVPDEFDIFSMSLRYLSLHGSYNQIQDKHYKALF